MFRPTVRGLVAVVLGAGLLFVETPIHSPGQVQAGKIRVSAMSLVYKPNKNPITVIPVSAKAAANGSASSIAQRSPRPSTWAQATTPCRSQP